MRKRHQSSPPSGSGPAFGDLDRLFKSEAEFFEAEDIVTKFAMISGLEHHCPYQPSSSNLRYWDRVFNAVGCIPEFRRAALALFANVVFLNKDLLEETIRVLATELAAWCGEERVTVPEDVHIFGAEDRSQVAEFYRLGGDAGWTGRSDQLTERYTGTITELLDRLRGFASLADDRKKLVRELFDKRVWSVLTDNVLSGGTTKADVGRLACIKELFANERDIKIVVCTQIITGQGIQELKPVLRKQKLIYGLCFDDRFRINMDECALFNTRETLEEVRRLCEKFAQDQFPEAQKGQKVSHPLGDTLGLHRKKGGRADFAYGWRDGGYTIVSYKNCPTNSVPLLWYPEVGPPPPMRLGPDEKCARYRPPFPRNPSHRGKHRTLGDGRLLAEIKKDAGNIRALLWG